MAPRKSIVLAAICALGAVFATQAQAQNPVYPSYQVPPTPQAWSYDPYTSGLTACLQWKPGDLQNCRQQMPPTYGQPNYRAR